jgi:hypothetical protein
MLHMYMLHVHVLNHGHVLHEGVLNHGLGFSLEILRPKVLAGKNGLKRGVA